MEHVLALIFVLPFLAVPAWSVWRMVRGARAGDRLRPGWFGHAAWASFLLMALAWLWGAAQGGLNTEKVCLYRRHQPFDAAYYEAHRADRYRLFPLSNKCNAGYDLVPGWVNPAVAVFFLLFVAGLAGLLWTAVRRRRRTSNDETKVRS